MLIHPDTSCLLVIDVQSRLLPAVLDSDQIEKSICDLIRIAAQLKVPVAYSEQYPKGLGPTSDGVLAALPKTAIRLEKLSFSCVADAKCSQQIHDLKQKQVVVCGMETHVCVLQTAVDLKRQGYEVFVVADAVSSRSLLNKTLGLERMRDLGIQIVSREMLAFEWLQQAGTDEFRAISKEYLK